MFFLISLMMLDFVLQDFYDIKITTNKFCLTRMYCCMCGVFILKKQLHKQKLEKLLQKLEILFSFLLYKFAVNLSKIKFYQIKNRGLRNFHI
jgi:hypothetical protein